MAAPGTEHKGLSAAFSAWLKVKRRLIQYPSIQNFCDACATFHRLGKVALAAPVPVPAVLRIFTSTAAWEATRKEIRQALPWIAQQGEAIQDAIRKGAPLDAPIPEPIAEGLIRHMETIARSMGAFEEGERTLRSAVAKLGGDLKDQLAQVTGAISGFGVPVLLGVAFLIMALKGRR